MRITKYNVELDDKSTVLVKEVSRNYEAESLDSPTEIVAMMNALFRLNKQADEHVYIVAFNTKMAPVGVFELSHGTINCSLVDARGIFLRALLVGASNIVMVHNHPSGNTNPSNEDINTCNRIINAGELLNIPLIDNIIVGNNYYSFHENGLIRRERNAA